MYNGAQKYAVKNFYRCILLDNFINDWETY